GVTEIGVVVDHHHQAPIVVPNAFTFRLESIGFPGYAAIEGISEARSLNQVIDVIHHVKYRMVPRNIFDFTKRKDFVHMRLELGPFKDAPKLINDPKAAALRISTKDGPI